MLDERSRGLRSLRVGDTQREAGGMLELGGTMAVRCPLRPHHSMGTAVGIPRLSWSTKGTPPPHTHKVIY